MAVDQPGGGNDGDSAQARGGWLKMGLDRRAFLAWLAMSATIRGQPGTDDWQDVPRVIAIGDVHGDKDALVAVLRMASVIDAAERWTGGTSHVVQVGDVPARGPQTRQALDLLMRLEQEALGAGGRVHALIGNHEVGVMYGDLRNVLPAEYEAFKSDRSKELLQAAFEREVDSLRKQGAWPDSPAERDALRASWFDRHPPGWVEHREAFRPSGHYGSWIGRHNAVIRINDSLFMHGGISPKYARATRSSLNAAIRSELATVTDSPPPRSTELLGPIWYRGLAEDDGAAPASHVEAVLAFHGVGRIVIGHTVTRTAILPRYDGRVVNVDLGLSRFYGRPPACLVLEAQSSYVLHRGVKVPLPKAGAVEYRQYLEAVEAADEQPSPISRLLGKGA